MTGRKLGWVLLTLALVVAATPLLADSNVRIVRLSYVDGTVQIDRHNGNGYEKAVLNQPITQGMRLATRDDGTAEVEFEDGSTLRLVPRTSVAFEQLMATDSGVRLNSIELLNGTLYLDAARKKDDFTLRTAGQEILVDHPAKLRFSRSGSDIRLAVFKGDADAETESGSVRVKKDETYALDLNDPAHYYLAKGIDAFAYDDWNQERDKYRDSYAANHHDGYNSAYSYGWSDLNYYGTFANYPGYGFLWQPYGMGSLWNPWSDGAWMQYPFGYMFVAAYPWGWMPYRYGTWIYLPSAGWCWRPATVWTTWYNVAPVNGTVPPGFVAPHPPAGTTSQTVTVGRGPLPGVHAAQFEALLQARNTDPRAQLDSKAGVTPVPARPLATTVRTFPSLSAQPASGSSARFQAHTFDPSTAVPAGSRGMAGSRGVSTARGVGQPRSTGTGRVSSGGSHVSTGSAHVSSGGGSGGGHSSGGGGSTGGSHK